MKTGTRKIKAAPRKKSDPYYQTSEWKYKVEMIWQRDMCMCQECERNGMLKPLTKPSANLTYQGHVDHIKPRDKGGSDNMDNLELLCYHCHATKSNMERKPPLSGDLLINVIGNIASGKTTLCKKIMNGLDCDYIEINQMKQNTKPVVLLESSGLGWRVQYIKRKFANVFTIMCYTDYPTTVRRIEQRAASGYVYPSNRYNPIAFYNRLNEDISYCEYDIFIDTTEDNTDFSMIIKEIRDYQK